MSLLDAILGRPLATHEEGEQKIGIWQGVPMLGLDALSSATYGPEAALTILIPLGMAGLAYIGPLTLVILAILVILYLSYRQTIAAYPNGGGSYTVAKENLGTGFGLLAGAALMLDYVLNVAVGISAGVGALISAVPALHPHILSLCLGILVLITVVNLRGVRESGVLFALPTYLFAACLLGVLGIGYAHMVAAGGHPVPVVPPVPLPRAVEGVTAWLLVRAFASGCAAMTGVEAVSNGVTAFAEPATVNAQRTLTVIVAMLSVLLGGIAYLCRAYGVGAADPLSPGYQSVISQLAAAVVGRGWFYYVTLAAVLAVLCLSANTSFAGFPRLCRLIAEDDFLPHAFSNKGRRLVFSHGIVVLAVLAGLLLVLFGGITDRLIPLFAVGAFLAFTLSQAGMVLHWRRTGGRHAGVSLGINALGALATAVALGVILVAKFREGAWITVLLIPATLALFYGVRRHYAHLMAEIRCDRPIDVSSLTAPVVVVPVLGWNSITEKALRFALRLSPDIVAVHVATDEEAVRELRQQWAWRVEEPLRAAGLPQPALVTLSSPYRHVVTPVVRFLEEQRERYPDRQIAVVVPELVEAHWWEYLLHNQRAMLLKAGLQLRGDNRLVFITVPWYLDADGAPGSDADPASRPVNEPPKAS